MSKKNDKKRIGAFNYKIEQLEPRMMMNADVVLDDFGDNISNVSTTVESALSEVDDLQLSGLGLDESLEPRFMMDASVDYETFTNAEHFQTEITEQLQNFETADLSNLGLNGAQVEASALFNGIATDAVQKFNTLQNQIASQLNDPDAGLSGIVRQDGEIVSVDKATLLSVLAA